MSVLIARGRDRLDDRGARARRRRRGGRQGALAGPAVVEQALAAQSRTTRLAAIAAAPLDRGPRRAAARARRPRRRPRSADRDPRRARRAHDRARARGRTSSPDDLAADDFAGWRALFESIAESPDRFVEVRCSRSTPRSARRLSTSARPARRLRSACVRAAGARSGPASRARCTAAAARADRARPMPIRRSRSRPRALLCADDPKAAVAALGTVGVARLAKLPRDRDAARCLR